MNEYELTDPELASIARELRRPVTLDPGVRDRILDSVRAEALPVRERGLGWLVERRTIRRAPLATLAAAASLVGIGLLAGLFANRGGRTSVGPSSKVAERTAQLPVHTDTVQIVKFVFVAPGARQVSLVGDFNQWNASTTPMARDASRTLWSVSLQLPAGRHVYAFVVDGDHWVADPHAPLAPDDGFGAHNSVVLVGGPST